MQECKTTPQMIVILASAHRSGLPALHTTPSDENFAQWVLVPPHHLLASCILATHNSIYCAMDSSTPNWYLGL